VFAGLALALTVVFVPKVGAAVVGFVQQAPHLIAALVDKVVVIVQHILVPDADGFVTALAVQQKAKPMAAI
jgi:hypothetical protein